MKKTKQRSQPTQNPDPLISESQKSRFIIYAAAVSALFAFLLYANTLGHDYAIDDAMVISKNTVTQQGISAIPEIFSNSYRAGFWDRDEGLYRPMSVAMFAIEWQLAPENPAPGHWVNVLLYALTAFVLMLTLSQWFKNISPWIPLLVTLIFVAHPLHTEVVANIKSRDEILGFLFTLLSLRWLHQWLNRKKPLALVLSVFMYFLALLSKENALTLLPIVPVFIWFFSKESARQNIIASTVFVVFTGIYFGIRYQVLGGITGGAEQLLINNSLLGADNFMDRIATAIGVMGKYIYLMFIPYPLSFDYSYNQVPVVSYGSAAVLISTVVLLGLVFLAIKGIRKKDPVSFGLIFFFITISLVSNILFLIESSMAERFVYTPSLGFILALVLFLQKTLKFTSIQTPLKLLGLLKEKAGISLTLAAVLIVFSSLTVQRNSYWKNNLTLLEKDVETAPQSARVRFAYGSTLLIDQALKTDDMVSKNEYLIQSIQQLQEGVNILPNYADAWKHLGIAHKEMNQVPEAINAFEKARSYREFTDADFYIYSGIAYGLGKKYDKAISDLTRAINMDKNNAEAYNNRGLYLAEQGKTDSAMADLDKAISLKSNYYQAWYNKGNAMAKAANFPKAVEFYNAALKIKPDYLDALINAGNSCGAMKDYPNALKYLKQAEALSPANISVLSNISITYRLMGDDANAQVYAGKLSKVTGK